MKTKAKRTPVQIVTRKFKRWINNNLGDILDNIFYYSILILGVLAFMIFSYLIISFVLLLFAYPIA